jgi:hypothetical protein
VDKLHICLRNVFGSSWLGGALYVQNLARAVGSLPVEERDRIKLSIVVRSSNKSTVKDIARYVDSIHIDGVHKLFFSEACKRLAKIPFIPSQALNLRRFDFVYPEVAGVKAPYSWGGWIPEFPVPSPSSNVHSTTNREIREFFTVLLPATHRLSS